MKSNTFNYTRVVADGSGAVVKRIDYDSFGNVFLYGTELPDGNPVRSGKYGSLIPAFRRSSGSPIFTDHDQKYDYSS